MLGSDWNTDASMAQGAVYAQCSCSMFIRQLPAGHESAGQFNSAMAVCDCQAVATALRFGAQASLKAADKRSGDVNAGW